MAAFPQPFFDMAAFPRLEQTCAAMGVAMADNVHAEMRRLRRQETKLDRRCIKVLNKAFRQPSLKQFETVLSAVEVNPKISIKRDYAEDDDDQEFQVTFRGQRLVIVFDRRNRVLSL